MRASIRIYKQEYTHTHTHTHKHTHPLYTYIHIYKVHIDASSVGVPTREHRYMYIGRVGTPRYIYRPSGNTDTYVYPNMHIYISMCSQWSSRREMLAPLPLSTRVAFLSDSTPVPSRFRLYLSLLFSSGNPKPLQRVERGRGESISLRLDL